MRLVLHTIVLFMFPAAVGHAQVTYEDLASGFRNNERGLFSGSKWFRWSKTTNYGDKYFQALDPLLKRIEAKQADLKDEKSIMRSRQIENTFRHQINISNSVKSAGFELLISRSGAVLRKCDSTNVFPESISEDLRWNGEGEMRVLLFPREGTEYAVLNFAGGQSGSSILPKSDFKSVQEENFFFLNLGEGLEYLSGRFTSWADMIYPNNAGAIEVISIGKPDKDGRIKLRLRTQPQDRGLKIKFAFQIDAVIDIKRGCLPTEIKRSPIGIDGNQVLTGLADSFATESYEIEIGEIEDSYFARRIHYKSFATPMELSWETHEKGIDSFEEYFSFAINRIKTKVNKSEGILHRDILIDVEAARGWQPEDEESLFSLDSIPRLGSHIDSRTGEVLISKRVENVIGIELDNLNSVEAVESNQNPFWKQRWFFWFGMSLIALVMIGLSKKMQTSSSRSG